jgi:polysaccharide deacetylase family protein (PEP-CTERM system associated)
MGKRYKSAFTVDVEDGISIAMRDAFSVKTDQTERVVSLTSTILELLSQNNTKGTFFVLGQVAEKFPVLIKQIAQEGHELGVHGYNHLQFFRMTREEAFEEISSAKKLIEDISGQEVFGHRAPAFSITPKTQWGLDVIAEAGFSYDSSIMPIKGNRYGWPGFPTDICSVKTRGGYRIIEVPMSTFSFFGKQIPVGGGGYLRLFPKWITRKALKQVTKKRPAILYIHPYDLDTVRYPQYYFDELKNASFLRRNKMKSMWINRSSVYSKLSYLLDCYQFDTLQNILRDKNMREFKNDIRAKDSVPS